MKKCMSCFYENDDQNQVCGSCGAVLSGGNSQEELPKYSPPVYNPVDQQAQSDDPFHGVSSGFNTNAGQGYNQPPGYNQQGYNQPGYNPQGYNGYNGPPAHSPTFTKYLIFSIIAFFCCSMIPGILGLIFTFLGDSEFKRGNYPEYEAHQNRAKWSLIIGVGLALLLGVAYFVIMMVAGFSDAFMAW